MRIVVDSNGWLEYFTAGKLAPKFKPYIDAANPQHVFTPTIVLFEVFKKLARERNRETAIQAVAHITAKTTVIQLTSEIALQAADLSLSKNLAMADAIIKATSDDMGATLITTDPDFKKLPKVELVQ